MLAGIATQLDTFTGHRFDGGSAVKSAPGRRAALLDVYDNALAGVVQTHVPAQQESDERLGEAIRMRAEAIGQFAERRFDARKGFPTTSPVLYPFSGLDVLTALHLLAITHQPA